jgi:hypothetical protein
MVAFEMLTFVLLLLLPVVAAAQAVPQDSRIAPALASARRVSSELTDQIRNLLMRELETGGFAGAVAVCSRLAQKTTRDFSAQAGHSVRRVSLKHRNPNNLPDPYEARQLAQLERLHQGKRMPAETWEVVTEGSRENLRYLKPIVVLPMCLTCHGPDDNIPTDVRAVLEKEYPRDRATGYRAGEFRGAVSVIVALPEQ